MARRSNCEILIPKSETNRKFKSQIRNPKRALLEFANVLSIRNCLGFRALNFEFQLSCIHQKSHVVKFVDHRAISVIHDDGRYRCLYNHGAGEGCPRIEPFEIINVSWNEGTHFLDIYVSSSF